MIRLLPALEKLQRYLATANRWKIGQKAFFLALLRVWFTDDNAIVRQKLRAIAIREIAPLLAEIIRQGIQEGVMTVSLSRSDRRSDCVSGAGRRRKDWRSDSLV